MIGVVLAAGKGSRLGEVTAELPKSLLDVDGRTSILETIVVNFRDVGLTDAVVVTGFRADRVQAIAPDIERRTGVTLHLLYNDHFATRNNAYSLWLARESFSQAVLLCNGDTLHPRSVPEQLLAARSSAVLLAVDDVKALGEEEMKVRCGPDGRLTHINKRLAPASSHGEYIGVSIIEPQAGEALASCLADTWQSDPTLYYEDGFAEYVRRGGWIGTTPIGDVPWVEVDTPADLARARSIAGSVLRPRDLTAAEQP